MAKKRKTKVRPPNMLFPGLPHYKGPNRGWFAFVHHGKLFEHTSNDGDSIATRVQYVRKAKPKDEIRIRLSHIMYLGAYLGRKLTRMKYDIPTQYEAARIHEIPEAREAVLAYVKKHKPRNQWREDRGVTGTLVKADNSSMTG